MSATATASPARTAADAANAANAKFSTGPRTPEGKDRIKFNALKTGLYARTVVLPDEDLPYYESLGAGLRKDYQPQSDSERELVLTIQNTMWRLSRVVELEFSLFAVGAQQQLAAIEERFPDQSLHGQYALARAAAYVANIKAFDQVSRQEARLQRLLDTTNKEIHFLTSQRPAVHQNVSQTVTQPAPQHAESAPPEPSLTADAAPAATPSGFVPSKYPANMPIFEGKRQGEHRRRWLRANGYKNLN
jgi:hypothetical protein